MITNESRNSLRQRRHVRLRKKISGTENCPRLCVFRSNANIEVQLIDDTKGMTLAATSSMNLKLENGGNIEAAKTVGEAIAKIALEKGIKTVVFDRGGYNYHGRVQAVAQAAREAGLEF